MESNTGDVSLILIGHFLKSRTEGATGYVLKAEPVASTTRLSADLHNIGLTP